LANRKKKRTQTNPKGMSNEGKTPDCRKLSAKGKARPALIEPKPDGRGAERAGERDAKLQRVEKKRKEVL